MAKPCRDPNCQMYIDDPNREWFACRWMTTEQIEKHRATRQKYEQSEKRREYYQSEKRRESNRKGNAFRIFVGGVYAGRV